MKIGIFGFIGSGKTTAIDYLEENYPIKVLNLDKISRLIMDQDEAIAFVRNTIPEAYIIENQSIDRSKLREILFTKKRKNKIFAKFIWPKIGDFVSKILLTLPAEEHVVIEGAILPTLNIPLDRMICLESPQSQILERIKKRDCRDEKETKALLKIQKSWLKDAGFHSLLKNDQSLPELYHKIDKLMIKYGIPKKSTPTKTL